MRPGNKKSIMIYVQHLLGIGHLQRAVFLASALARRGFIIDLVSGGMPVPVLNPAVVNFHQLPPLRSLNGRFDLLVNENGKSIDENWKHQRCNQLLELFNNISPDAVITETFPFGRRMMRFELLPMLNAIKQRSSPPILISSIRDILQPKARPDREQEILHLVDEYYDRVLVHGDDSIATLEDTFSMAAALADKTFYTGYICQPGNESSTGGAGVNEVLVSGGGGVVSLPLLQAAIEARPLSKLNQQTWRLLAGHSIDQQDFEQLVRIAGKGFIVERNRSDFQQLLRQCAVSVSQAGYNTTMDILKTGARSVMVPFSDAGEIEQTIRARLLQQHNRVITLDQEKLTAASLAQAIDQAIEIPRQSIKLKMNGAEVSADLLQEWLHV